MGLQLDGGDAQKESVVGRLRGAGYPVVDMTDNELAKVHARHLVGGRAGVRGERVFRFEFPERPGALRQFLQKMRPDWNITLFHYRNHGAAVGRVLVGMQVPAGEEASFRRFLDELAYPQVEETENPVYRLFLGGPGSD